MKKAAWGIFRMILACIVLGIVGFAGYYILWGINWLSAWGMDKIVWLWGFVQSNWKAAAILVALICVGSALVEIAIGRYQKRKTEQQ